MKKESFWIHCPNCDSKTDVKVFEDTVLLSFPLYCPCCKKETVVDVVKLKLVPTKER